MTVDQPLDVATPWVGIDDRTAAREAARHLVQLGHERVAVVGFPEATLDEMALPFEMTRERFAGFREGLGGAWDDLLVTRGRGNRADTGSEAVADLLSLERPPTAVLAMSDALAAGVLLAATARGLEVPADLSVVGFDDVPLAARTDPPLTTVAQPTEDKGRVAARRLLDALDADGLPEPTRTVLPTHLVVRGSSGPPGVA